jgi:ABC-type transporter Mla subunit MlaD
VPMGAVDQVSVEGGRAVATLKLDPDAAGKLHEGAEARIVPRSALQDLTVDIDPGDVSNPALTDGAAIETDRTSTTVGTDRVIDVLDVDTRAQAQVLLSQLSAGVHGRSPQLRADLAELSKVVDSTTGVTSALAERRHELTRFVDELDQLFAVLRERRASLADGIDVGQRTLAVTGARDQELAQSIAQLPSTMGRVRSALGSVTRLSRPLDPALEKLRPLADRLPGALSAVREFTPDGRALLSDIRDLSDRGRAPVRSLQSVLRRLGPAASGAKPTVADLLAVIKAIDKNKEGIGELGDNFSGVFSTNDANGPILRGLGFFEPFDPADLGFPANATPAQKTAASAEAIKALSAVCLTQNPIACVQRYLIPGLPGFVGSKGAGDS